MQTGAQLRSLFVTILIHGPLANSRHLWDVFKVNLSDDCAQRLRRNGNENPSSDHVESLSLNIIKDLLSAYEKSLEDFNLPEPLFPMEVLLSNRVMA
jgi:hypothetical protein